MCSKIKINQILIERYVQCTFKFRFSFKCPCEYFFRLYKPNLLQVHFFNLILPGLVSLSSFLSSFIHWTEYVHIKQTKKNTHTNPLKCVHYPHFSTLLIAFRNLFLDFSIYLTWSCRPSVNESHQYFNHSFRALGPTYEQMKRISFEWIYMLRWDGIRSIPCHLLINLTSFGTDVNIYSLV